ncbi:MAG TPA: NUDIX domain-containing protein [Candidatus Kapabacteria bacterium]|nr:NUDIX domain-containing protein [Candidatus Kapabacteria bacterium]
MHRVEAYKILGIPVSSSDEADYLLEKMINGDIEKAKRVELVTVRGKNKVFQRKQLVGKKEDDSPKLRGSKLFEHLGSNRYSDKEIDSTIKDYFGSQGKSFTYSDKIQRKFVLQFLENTEEVIKKLPKNHFAGNDYLKSVDLRFWDRSGIAAYEDTKKRIVFSRDVIKSVANDKITDITDKLELQSIFAHEIGHSVWEKFTQLSKGEKNIDKLKEFNKICGWGYQDPTAYEMSSSTGFAKRKRRVETDIERLITPYAETNSQEAFSEYYAFYALNRKLVDELISVPFRTNQSKKIPFRGGEEVSYKKIVDSKPVFAWMKENIFENKHFEKALEDDIEKGMSERERENRWHEMFYALQREGHSSESAAKIATSKYGSHSDKKRTKEDHMRTYKHLHQTTEEIQKAMEQDINPNGGENKEKEAQKIGKQKQFVDVLIFNEKDELLLLRRTIQSDFEPLKWCLPGGHIDIGETPEIAAKREVFEETGVEVTELYPVYIYETPEVKINYFEANYIDSEIHLVNEEHSNYVFTSDWYDYDLLMNLRDNLEKIINIRINELEKALDNIDIEKAIKGQLNRSRLVKKTIVDKNGKRVTKWVKPSEIEAPEKIRKPQEQKVDDKKSEKIEPKKTGEKKPEEYAKQTKTSDLEKYIKKPNSDEKLKNIAKEEIQKRKDGKSKEPTKTSGNKEERPKVEKPKRKEKFYDGLVKKYKLSRTPKDYVKKEDVIIDETDPENHWVMRWTEINERTGKPKVMTSYSQSFLDKNKEKKFERIRKIKPAQIELVKKQAVKMIDNEDSSIAQSSAIIAIIAHTGLRPGDRKGFLDTGNRGVSTLGASNILIDGDEIRFDFTGKSYKENKAFIKDAKLAEYLDKLKKEKMGEEFIFDVSKSKIVNVFHNKLNFKGFKLKDMRTYVACDVAKNILFTDKTPPPPLSNTKTAIKKEITTKIRKVCEIVAEKLNNTPTMAKSSYIDPKVFDAWLFGLGVQPELIQKAMDGEVISLQDIIKNNQESQVVDTDEYNDFDDELNDDVDEYPVPDWMDLDEPEQKLKNYLIKKEGEEVSKAELISLFEEVGLGNKTIETILKTNNSKE